MITDKEIDKITDKEAMYAELRDLLGQLAMIEPNMDQKETLKFVNTEAYKGIRLLDKIAATTMPNW